MVDFVDVQAHGSSILAVVADYGDPEILECLFLRRKGQGNTNGGNGFIRMMFVGKCVLCSSKLFAIFVNEEGKLCWSRQVS